MIRIKIYDKEYPYLPTMGAMLAFKEETGIEVTDVSPADSLLNAKFAYFVVKYACLHTREEAFGLSFEEFCSGLSTDEYYRVVAETLQAGQKQIDAGEK
ncbi:MAG: hypothetical protein RR410_04825 [Alistipes sp.]